MHAICKTCRRVIWFFGPSNNYLRRQLDWNLLVGKSTCSLLYSSPRIQFSIHVSHSIWGKRDGGCVVQGRRECVLLPNQLSTHRSVPGVCDPCHVCVCPFILAETGVYLRGMRLGQRTRHQLPIIALLRAVIVVHNVSLTAVNIRPVRDWLLENVAGTVSLWAETPNKISADVRSNCSKSINYYNECFKLII